MGYHVFERIRGSPEDPYIRLWKRLGVDYELPVVPRDAAVPPNRLQLVVVKSVTEEGKIRDTIDISVEWQVYEPYGDDVDPYTDETPVTAISATDPDEQREAVAGRLPIPPSFFERHGLTIGAYLECFITGVYPSDGDRWIVPYPAQVAPPTGADPAFDYQDVLATVTDCDVELE